MCWEARRRRGGSPWGSTECKASLWPCRTPGHDAHDSDQYLGTLFLQQPPPPTTTTCCISTQDIGAGGGGSTELSANSAVAAARNHLLVETRRVQIGLETRLVRCDSSYSSKSTMSDRRTKYSKTKTRTRYDLTSPFWRGVW